MESAASKNWRFFTHLYRRTEQSAGSGEVLMLKIDCPEIADQMHEDDTRLIGFPVQQREAFKQGLLGLIIPTHYPIDTAKVRQHRGRDHRIHLRIFLRRIESGGEHSLCPGQSPLILIKRPQLGEHIHRVRPPIQDLEVGLL